MAVLEKLLVEMAEAQRQAGDRAGRGARSRGERYRDMQERMGVRVLPGSDQPGASDAGAALRELMVGARAVFETNRSTFRDMALRGFDVLADRKTDQNDESG